MDFIKRDMTQGQKKHKKTDIKECFGVFQLMLKWKKTSLWKQNETLANTDYLQGEPRRIQ